MKKINKYLIIGMFLIITSIILSGSNYFVKKIDEKNNNDKIQEYYEKETISEENNKDDSIESKEEKTEENIKSKVEYIAILKIPKINLIRGLVDKNSKYNNVNYNLEIIKESDMPDIDGGNLIIAGHSGNAYISYFKNLDKLVEGDIASIDFNNKTYTYKLVEKYDITKNGKAVIKRDNSKTTLTLITCRHNTDKQIIFILERI